MGFLGEKREFLADRFTPDFLMGLCEGLTDLQAQDSLRLFIGQWIRVGGNLEHATPNPNFGAAGVTIVFPGDKRRDAFLWFERDLDELAKIGRGERITVEGRITSITSDGMRLENCGLADRQIASIMKVGVAADELRRAAEDWTARQEKLSKTEPPSDPKPPPESIDDDRKNLTSAEAKRFSEFLLSEMPNITERGAHKRALAFFHDRKVPRDWFWGIFRAIRGPKSPGKPPKARD